MKRAIAIGLSVLLLLSSTGITYAEHFCGSFKMMAKLTVGHENLNCGMAVLDTDCDTEFMQAMDCCNNHYLSVSTDDTFAKVQFDFVSAPVFIVPPVSNYNLNILSATYKPVIALPYYRPPPNIKSLHLVYESFLI